MTTLKANLDARGFGSVKLNDVDISKFNRGLEIKSDVLEGQEVILRLANGQSLDLILDVTNLSIECPCPNCGEIIKAPTR